MRLPFPFLSTFQQAQKWKKKKNFHFWVFTEQLQTHSLEPHLLTALMSPENLKIPAQGYRFLTVHVFI